MNRVVHFEIPANDPPKLIEFYKNVFGWNIQQWGNQEYWMAITGEKNEAGIDGAIFKPKAPMHGDGFVNTIKVKDIDETCKNIKNAEGQIVVEKFVIPGVGYCMYCKDTEGNLFGIIQEDSNAK